MKKKFLTSIIILLGVNFLIKPFWIFGIDRTVQNLTGPSEYGLYFAVFNFAFIFNIFLDLGITNFNNRNISQHAQLLEKHFYSISILKVLLGILYLILTLVIGYVIGYSSRQFVFLLFLSFNQFLLSFILYLRSNISGLQLFKTDSLLSVLDRFIMILICAYLIWGTTSLEPFQIEWFVYAQTAAYAITFLIALCIVIQKTGLKKPKWNYPFIIMILKKSFPYALLILLMAFYNRIDSVMLERMVTEGEYHAGIYASAYRILDAFNMIAYLFAIILLPLFARMLKTKEAVIPIVRLSFSFLFVLTVFVAVISVAFAQQIISSLYVYYTKESIQVFSILMFCMIPVALTYIFGTLLTANGNLYKLNIIAFCGMCINIVFNLIFIPNFQAVGAASVSLMTQLFTALVQVLLAVKMFKMKIQFAEVVKYVTYVLSTIFVVFFLKYFLNSWLIAVVISGTIALSIAFGLKIMKPLVLFKLFFSTNK